MVAPRVAPPSSALASGGEKGVATMGRNVVGWDCLTFKGRCAMRRWYRAMREVHDRTAAKRMIEAQVYGAYGASHFGWAEVLP